MNHIRSTDAPTLKQSLAIAACGAAITAAFLLAPADLHAQEPPAEGDWTVMLGAGAIFLHRRIFSLMRYIREPLLIAFSTASSEAAMPKLFEQLDRFGFG